jgi:hypothetical protein
LVSKLQRSIPLLYDGNKGIFVCSGKVTHWGFTVHTKEHFDESKKVKSSTHFYDVYPLSTCPRANKMGTKGNFEILQQIIAAGWDPTSNPARIWTEVGRTAVF